MVYWTHKCGAGNRFASPPSLSARWQYAKKISFPVWHFVASFQMSRAPSFENIYLLTIIHTLPIQNLFIVDFDSKDTIPFLKSEDQSGKRLYHEKLSQIRLQPIIIQEPIDPDPEKIERNVAYYPSLLTTWSATGGGWNPR